MTGETKRVLSIAAVASFAGLLLGLLTPITLFSQRLAVQEERWRIIVQALSDIRSDTRDLGKELSNLRETVAAQRAQRR